MPRDRDRLLRRHRQGDRERSAQLSNAKASRLHPTRLYPGKLLPARERAAPLIEAELPRRLCARKAKRASEAPLERPLAREQQEDSSATEIAFPRRKLLTQPLFRDRIEAGRILGQQVKVAVR